MGPVEAVAETGFGPGFGAAADGSGARFGWGRWVVGPGFGGGIDLVFCYFGWFDGRGGQSPTTSREPESPLQARRRRVARPILERGFACESA